MSKKFGRKKSWCTFATPFGKERATGDRGALAETPAEVGKSRRGGTESSIDTVDEAIARSYTLHKVRTVGQPGGAGPEEPSRKKVW